MNQSRLNNISHLFNKLDDMKSLFQYGQKIVPILQSLVDFMQETVPLLENINNSIADSTSKIPKATTQISSVTNATELATTEILDLVDIITNTLYAIDADLKKIIVAETKKTQAINELKSIIAGNSRAEELITVYFENDSTVNLIDKILKHFPQLITDTGNITISLQVQDITSQQLAAVNHLIQSVQKKLASLILDIDESKLEDLDKSGIDVPQGSTFDPNASYDKSEMRQDMVDAIINKESHKASQDEIDKLFS